MLEGTRSGQEFGMADISSAMSQMVIMVLIVVIGFVATKFKVIGQESVKTLSNLLFYVTLPCTMLGSVLNGRLSFRQRSLPPVQ